MVEFEYYEFIAAEIFNIPVIDIWKKTRKIEIALARQFCMVYRHVDLRMSQSLSAGRYDKDHSNVPSAMKKLQQYRETKDVYWDLYAGFKIQCDIASKSNKKTIEPKTSDERLNVSNHILSLGWRGYMTESREMIENLFKLIHIDSDETNIRCSLDVCIERLNDLKYLYNNE